MLPHFPPPQVLKCMREGIAELVLQKSAIKGIMQIFIPDLPPPCKSWYRGMEYTDYQTA